MSTENKDTQATEINKAKRADMFKIDPRAVVFDVDNDNNPRKNYGDMDSLKMFIKENGTENLDPIMVKKFKNEDGEERFQLKHGYRRMSAIMELIAEGVEIARVRSICVLKTFNDEDELVAHISQNSGLPLSPYEEATVYKQLEGNGWSQAEVAKKCGKTPAHISNMIKITACTKRVQKAMADGMISPSLVLKIMNKHGDNADSVIATAIATARTLSKTRVTEKMIDASLEGKAPVARTSRYQKVITSAITMVTENKNTEQLAKLNKAQEFVTIMDTFTKPEELIEKLMEVM